MKFPTVFAVIVSLLMVACGAMQGSPSDQQVATIKNLCAVDAGVRPAVSALLAVPGLATPAEVAAVVAARAVIDPICADPAAPLQQQAITAFSSAVSQVVTIQATLAAKSQATPVAK